jgi:lipoate---protein ligase
VTWRVIDLETRPAAMNMALDQVAMEQVAATGMPIIRFYRHSPSTVVVGYFQSMRDEVDIEKCRERGISYVRRLSGGGAVYFDEHCYTYSVVAPEALYPKGIRESYQALCQPLIAALAAFGLPGEFRPINDITLHGRKISGNAQTRKNGVILHHGTLLYTLDTKTMFSVLKVDGKKLEDKAITAVEDAVTCLRNHHQATPEEFYEGLRKAFTHEKDHETSQWTAEELSGAKELVETRYGTDRWTFLR